MISGTARTRRAIALSALAAVLATPGAFAQVHFTNCSTNTGNNASLFVSTAINPSVNGRFLRNGDEIAVFTPDGLCAGVKVWDGTNTAVTVWGDDSITPEKDGMAAGDSLILHVWDSATDVDFFPLNADIDALYDSSVPFRGSPTYQSDALYNLTRLLIAEKDENRPPIASFTAAPVSSVDPYQMAFDASASVDIDGTVRNYLWNFGDGNTASGPTVTNTYLTAGSYTVSLSVSDDDGAVGAATTLLNISEPAPPENIPPSASFTVSPAPDGNGLKVNLDAASSADPDGSITAYTWTFGDGSSGSGRSTSHTYAAGGTYTIRLTVRDNQSATGTSSAPVTLADPADPVNQKPVASFTAVPTGASNGMEYEFDASASVDPDGSLSSYAWTYGDGSAGHGATVRHTFASAGTFTVRVTVTDNQGGTGSASADITVTVPPPPENQLPAASFTASQVSGSDYTVRFDGSPSYDRDGTIASYSWDFGDGASGSNVSTNHVYPGAGSYDVVLTVTDNSGATATSTATITLVAPDPPANEAPLASFTAAPGAADLEILFDASASRDPDGVIDTYQWDFGDGSTGSGERPSHVFGSAGSYTISLTVTDNSGSIGTASASVTVAAPEAPPSFPPLASFTASPVSGGDYTMRFDASGSSDPDGTISAFAWTFGDGTTGSGSTATHAYAGAGSYAVTLAVTDNEGNVSRATVSVELTEPDPPANQAPAASFTAAPGSADMQMAFDASGSSDSDGSIVSYRWDFGDGSVGFGRTAAHTYTSGGSYAVSLTVTDDAGSVGTASVTVTVVEPAAPQLSPAASFTAAPVSNAAQPYTMRFNAGSSYDPDGYVADFMWTFGDGDQSGSGQITEYSYPAPGTYVVSLTVTDNDGNTGRSSATIEITEAAPDPNQPPAASFTVSAGSTDFERLFSAAASNDTDGSIVSYRWDFGDGVAGDGVNVVHTYDATGDYAVTLIVSDEDGSVGTASATVRISEPKKKNLPPTASLKARERHNGNALSVEFDGSSSVDVDGAITSFLWEFGDGQTSTSPAVVHTYASVGNYTTTLTITDDRGASASASINLTLTDPEAPENQAPSASFAATQQTTAGPYVMRFDGSASVDADGTIASYEWNFGDGSSASDATVTHDYTAAGTYSVTLTVFDNQGTFGTSSTSIVLTEPQAAAELPPAASFTAMPAQDGPFSMEFDASSSVDPDGQIVTFSWDFGDGTSQQGATVTHTYAQAGSYEVRLFVTDDKDNTGSATASVTLIDPKQNSVPTASFVASPLHEVSPIAVMLDASGSFDLDGAIGQYLWDFGDGKGGSGKTTSHEYDASGSYVVTLTITDNNGATDSKADTIDVRFNLPEFLDLARVGSNQVRGYAEYQGDVLRVESEGSFGTQEEDAFAYVYSPLTGDGEVVARVVSMETTEPWAAAGVMIRERLSPSSRFVAMVMTEEYGSSFQQRSAPGTVGIRQTPGVGFLPYWVRLERKGSTVTGYSSIDGTRWAVMGQVEMEMASDIFIGVAVASNSDTVLTTASVDQISIESSEPEPVEIPTEYELSDIYPNPFNPVARFSLVLSQEEEVTIQVFDALGRLVRTLSTGELVPETRHEFVIDAAELTSGLYILRVEGDTFEDVRKAILLK